MSRCVPLSLPLGWLALGLGSPGQLTQTRHYQDRAVVLTAPPPHRTSPTTTLPPHTHTHLTTAERLARLRRLRYAWKSLDWTRVVAVPMPGPCCAYELVGGVFCKTQPSVRRTRGGGGWLGFPANGHIDAQGGEGGGEGGGDAEGGEGGEGEHSVHRSRTMSLTYLPKTHAQGHTVVRDDLGVATRDFAMDPSQDLMVFFKGGEDAGL